MTQAATKQMAAANADGKSGIVRTLAAKCAALIEPVKQATTREEREAIYRFRYEVYVEEFGRQLGSPDHQRRWVQDADDEALSTTLLYTGSLEKITGTVRLRHWRAGEVPWEAVETLSMDRFPDLAERNIAEIERLMVHRSSRGRRAVASLLRESYRILVAREGTDLCFCYCSPGLMRYYQQLAMRPFGGRLVHAPDGLMLPLVAVMSDHAYYRSSGSLLEPLVRHYFGPGKRQPLDLAPYAKLFTPGETGIEHEPERVRHAVIQALDGRGGSLFAEPSQAMKELIGRSLVIDVEAGALVTRQGFVEPELYVVLEGRFIADRDGLVLRGFVPGEPFGEDAFASGSGEPRRASVRAIEKGRLLVLRGRDLKRFLRRYPAAVSSLLPKRGAFLR